MTPSELYDEIFHYNWEWFENRQLRGINLFLHACGHNVNAEENDEPGRITIEGQLLDLVLPRPENKEDALWMEKVVKGFEELIESIKENKL